MKRYQRSVLSHITDILHFNRDALSPSRAESNCSGIYSAQSRILSEVSELPLRTRTMTSGSADDELSILSISEDLVPSPILIPSQQVTLAFDGLLHPPLVLQTNEKQCGGKLWPAGMVLAEYLLRNKMAEVQGKTMFVRSDAIPLSLITSTAVQVHCTFS